MLNVEHAHSNTSSDGFAESQDPYEQLAIVEQEVVKVSSTLTGLLKKVHQLKQHINHLQSPIIRILPPELVSEVILFYIPSFHQYTPKDDMAALFKFGAVCSLWRRIAWTTPALWATVTARFSDDSHRVRSQLALLEEWLSRAGDLPLSIRVCSSERTLWPPTTLESILKVLKNYAPRWQDLDLRLPSPCYFHLPASEFALPLLSTFSIDPPGGQGDRSNKITFTDTPQLTHLSLSCVYLRSMDFQWGVVTHLKLGSFYVDECLEVLRETPRLIDFDLRRVLDGDDRHAFPDAPLLLPELKSFTVLNDKDVDIKTLLDKMDTPKLASFTYTGGIGEAAFPAAQFASFIHRSSCPLLSLSLTHAKTFEEDFVTIFPHIPTLKSLSIDFPHSDFSSAFSDRVLKGCKMDLEKTWLPGLESLSYRGPQSFTWPVLLETIISRRPSGSFSKNAPSVDGSVSLNALSLTLLYDTTSLELDNEVAEGIRKLAECGLNCHVEKINEGGAGEVTE